MIKIIYIIIFLLISNCTLNKVVKHHGVHFLEKKQKKLVLNTTNKNDIISLLGPPSTKSTFDNDLWIYIERKQIESTIFKLGKDKMIVNNVLVVEIDNKGLLTKKDFININNMNEYKFTENETEISYNKRSYVYHFLSSLRQKINSPAKKRKRRTN
jgi:outer membrane protein assembly factor BamE (lipoprotein component of BamABCDE complex)